MPHHAAADRLADDQADPAATAASPVGLGRQQVAPPRCRDAPGAPAGHRREVGRRTKPVRRGQHAARVGSGRQFGAALAPAGLQDGAAGAGAHPQAGSRGSWPDGGCSVGRSACSRSRSITIRRLAAAGSARSAGLDRRHRPTSAAGRHGWNSTGSTPARQTRGQHTRAQRYGSTPPRSNRPGHRPTAEPTGVERSQLTGAAGSTMRHAVAGSTRRTRRETDPPRHCEFAGARC